MLLKPFTKHPESVGETYRQHMVSAFTFGLAMFKGSVCCLAHGLFPFLFERTGSKIVQSLHDRMIVSRPRTDSTTE